MERVGFVYPECANSVVNISKFHEMLRILVFSIGDSEVALNKSLKVRDQDNLTKYHLSGVIYLGVFHFTSHIVKRDGGVWFHDGQTSARNCYYERFYGYGNEPP